MDKVNYLTKWKAKARDQLKLLYKRQIRTIDIVKYNEILNQLQIANEQRASLQCVESDFRSEMAHRQEAERKYFENMTRVKDLETENLELELELEMVKKRLSTLDPAF